LGCGFGGGFGLGLGRGGGFVGPHGLLFGGRLYGRFGGR